jgi:hypothetical protein
MNRHIALILLACAALLTGCASAPQQPVALTGATLSAPAGRIGIAMSAMPKVDTSFPGAGCLLCLAAASVANSTLTNYTKTLPSEDLLRVKGELAELLRKKGHDTVVIDEAIIVADLPNAPTSGPNLARKDFTALRSKYKLDKLVVIDITEIGISRAYAAYIPTSDPQGVVNGSGYLVNLKDNTFEWFLPLKQARSANGKWDEAPTFPSLSNAYFQALEGAHDALIQPFN